MTTMGMLWSIPLFYHPYNDQMNKSNCSNHRNYYHKILCYVQLCNQVIFFFFIFCHKNNFLKSSKYVPMQKWYAPISVHSAIYKLLRFFLHELLKGNVMCSKEFYFPQVIMISPSLTTRIILLLVSILRFCSLFFSYLVAFLHIDFQNRNMYTYGYLMC